MSRETFNEMIEITGLTVNEVIDIEKNAAAETVASCNIDTCTEAWHWCTGCECHLDEDNTCNNCD
jgi:hypothetical protein